MRTPIKLPHVGESIVELRIIAWLKRVGDVVERDEQVVEVSTEKIDFFVTSPAHGTLVAIAAQADDVVPVGAIVGYIAEHASP